ncbi:unnamed protein product [Caenorhabditis auriculariae]|uniref:Domain of unknown function WSN domain-containing protein n=1 Tax=Caenorhabditis auriculariae TaxID=2777116 RepID=A0A8S1HVF8_9PELO|nr:unnamed protein product [Caenorhabditis auriculariae]
MNWIVPAVFLVFVRFSIGCKPSYQIRLKVDEAEFKGRSAVIVYQEKYKNVADEILCELKALLSEVTFQTSSNSIGFENICKHSSLLQLTSDKLRLKDFAITISETSNLEKQCEAINQMNIKLLSHGNGKKNTWVAQILGTKTDLLVPLAKDGKNTTLPSLHLALDTMFLAGAMDIGSNSFKSLMFDKTEESTTERFGILALLLAVSLLTVLGGVGLIVAVCFSRRKFAENRRRDKKSDALATQANNQFNEEEPIWVEEYGHQA